ncbi:kinetochore Sim4 complex subunit FTA2-domain-containing protein [Stachybotrys elegans]|uniref:Kinetochore Sim4 complex subunit FTA2-domain-containing protein n=1 Tax=Stachybotrys elegans TaxID=80388 RepID=A0A8K0SXP0_9HYPO|nr:kinetochore Sim4 complex subunit FTA2-domain-containing protein [Stachybotrys elegans]
MSRQKPSHIPEELPPCNGPKLEQFKHHKSPIEWRERLDAHRDNDDATEGFVFRAIIKRREYAIKVFKFFNPRSTEPFWGPVVGRDTPLDTAAYYSDPFFAECRAYGRINKAVKQRKLRGDVAIPCHGFLFLQKRDEEALDRYDLDFNLDNVDLDYQNSTVAGCRLRAIVKDIASSDPGVGTQNLGRILSGISALNKAKVYSHDIQLDNFRDGRLVDFGCSITEPHLFLKALNEASASGYREADRVQFDNMVVMEKIPNPKQIRALPDPKYTQKLRSSARGKASTK